LYADEKMAVIPDFIANCGMARVFANLMEKVVPMTDEAIFQDISQTIFRALRATYEQRSTPHRIAQTSFERALRVLLPNEKN